MATEKRLIDANALEAAFRETKMTAVFPNWLNMDILAKCAVIEYAKKVKDIVTNAPTVDAVEVVHGKWAIIEDDYTGMTALECSECKQEYWFEDDEPPIAIYNYCPNCGAKMDGKCGMQ